MSQIITSLVEQIESARRDLEIANENAVQAELAMHDAEAAFNVATRKREEIKKQIDQLRADARAELLRIDSELNF